VRDVILGTVGKVTSKQRSGCERGKPSKKILPLEMMRPAHPFMQVLYQYNYDKVQRTTSRLDDFTTYDLTTFTTSRLLVIDLETGFTVQKWVSRSIKSRKVVKVVKS